MARRLKVDRFDYGEVAQRIALMTAGLSGREIAKLGVAWQAAAYASEQGVLTEGMVMDRVEDAIRQNRKKVGSGPVAVLWDQSGEIWSSVVIFSTCYFEQLSA